MSFTLRTDYPKARKDHKCFGCLSGIPKDTVYRADTVVDNLIFTCRLCDECVAKVDSMDSCDGDEFCEGDLRNIEGDA